MRYLNKLFSVASAAFFIATSAFAQSGTVTNHAFAVGRGAGITGYSSALCTSAQLAIGQSAADPLCKTITGDVTLSAAGATTLATVNANVGPFGSATSCPAFTVNAKGLITAASAATCTPAIGSITGLGTGVATALGVNVGSAGAFVTFNGALGTPSSGTATNLTGTASGLTAGTVTTNANLTGDVTSVGNAATIAANAVTNAKAAQMAAYTVKGNATGSTANATDISIPALTQKASPVAADKIMIADSAASNALKYATVSSIASAGSVSSIAGNTGAFTLSNGITNSTNDIRLNVGHLPGETSTGSAAAGEIGEFISATATTGTLTTSTATNVTSITLTAGDWDITAGYSASGSSTPTVTDIWVSINTVTATNVNTAGQNFRARGWNMVDPVTAGSLGPLRVSLSGSTTYYLNCQATYSPGTFAVTGIIRARRVR